MSRFNAFAQGYLIKSGNKNTPYKVGGILTTEDRDIDGEILKSIDWTHFTGGFGKIKYEHDEIKGPGAIIGFPTKLMKKGRETHFEGDIIPFDMDLPEEKLTAQQRLAKSTITLLQHIEEFNKRNPHAPQRAGWSIEGEVIEKNKKSGLVKARVADVVFTTKPRNMHTFAQILKSLNVGYGMEPETQTGFGATRKESFGTNKNHSSKGEKKMRTKEAVYAECLKKGMSREEAKKKADEFENERIQMLESKQDVAEKSLGVSRDALKKSLDTANEALEIEVNADIDGTRKRIEKSLRTNKDGEVEDIGDFLSEVQNTSLRSLEMVEKLSEKVDKIAKSLSARVEADLSSLDSVLYLQDAVTESNDQVVSLRSGLASLVKSLQSNSNNLIPSERAQSFSFDDNDKEQEGELTKSQTVTVLDKLAEAGDIDSSEVIKYESTGRMSDSIGKLVKSRAKDFIK